MLCRPPQSAQFGRRVASGRITPGEFASSIIKSLKLPNRPNDKNYHRWDAVGLEIRPLELILEIIGALAEAGGKAQGYLTPAELQRIVVPLAGVKAPVAKHGKAVMLHRAGKLDLPAWPDCAPLANDRRMVREFLLFLSHYEYCHRQEAHPTHDEKYFLAESLAGELSSFLSLDTRGLDLSDVLAEIRNVQPIVNSERRRRRVSVLERPGQAVFRRDVLKAHGNMCLLTGESIPEALEAAHIRPVKVHGNDVISNGLCLRVDVHSLYDAGHIRIDPAGHIAYSEPVSSSPNYGDGNLPPSISIPAFIDPAMTQWRWSYY